MLRQIKSFRRFASKEVQTIKRPAEHQVRVDIPRGAKRIPYNIKVAQALAGGWHVDSIERLDFFDVTAYRCTHVKTGA